MLPAISGLTLAPSAPNCTGVFGMVEERDVWDSARNMVERYGDGALREVGLRIQELQEHGQSEARHYWLRVEKAVEALLETKKGSRGH